MSNINGPIPNEWAGYVTQSNVGLEVVPSILYDTQTYTTAVTTVLPFFNSVPANDSISNVNPPAVLPNPSSFLIKTIGIYFPNQEESIVQGVPPITSVPSQFNDILLLVNTGICRMTIGDKPYGPWPMYRLPISTYPRLSLAVAGATAANSVTQYGQTDGPMYPLLPPLLIAPLQRFRVTLEWPAGAVTLLASRTIKLVLDGQLARGIQ